MKPQDPALKDAAPGASHTSSAQTASARANAVRFRLEGPSREFDHRTHAYRRDVADVALAGKLFAPHYARQLDRTCVAAAMVRSDADPASEAVSQLLHGEGFAILDLAGGWAWGFCLHDHYVGYVPEAALGDIPAATHWISARQAPCFSAASIKAPVINTLSLGARISGVEQDGFLATADGFLHLRHVKPIGRHAPDAVAVAEMLLGAPYLWGGRGDGGIDCSGLVQLALGCAGIVAPRDTDQQRDTLGAALPADAILQRGDIIFFPGHVGMMVDATRMIHANAHWMAVTIEPLADVVARLKPNHDQPILVRRRLAQ